MMSKNIRIYGFSTVALLVLGAGAALYLAPSVAISKPALAGSLTETDGDPPPQRFEVAQAQTRGGSALPADASSLNETYWDWRVSCARQGTTKRCVISQVQTQKSGRRVLAIELNAPNGNTVSGTLVMPFGLALDSGITFQIDDKPAMQPIRFRTCLPVGCIVPVTFDAPTLAALRAGAVLKVRAVADGGAATPFSISLRGFGTALDRVGVLSR